MKDLAYRRDVIHEGMTIVGGNELQYHGVEVACQPTIVTNVTVIQDGILSNSC